MSLTTVRSAERARTTTDWLTSRHTFSFGDHYDPANTHHGVLLVQNEEIVTPGAGFDTHPHAETEIVTWVLSGSLIHQDSAGNSGIIHPGLAQRMSAGSGVLHSERNDHAETHGADVHFLQMWIRPDEFGLTPGYDQLDITDELLPGRLVALASGDPAYDSAIRIANRSATLHVARLLPGQRVRFPAARLHHLHVVRGDISVESVDYAAGDAIRARDAGGTEMTAITDSEILLWSMNAALGE